MLEVLDVGLTNARSHLMSQPCVFGSMAAHAQLGCLLPSDIPQAAPARPCSRPPVFASGPSSPVAFTATEASHGGTNQGLSSAAGVGASASSVAGRAAGVDAMFNGDFRRMSHNYSLDRGMKFMINYRTPSIEHTDLFDLDKFGCFDDLRDEPIGVAETQAHASKAVERWAACSLGGVCGKQWYRHPSIRLNAPMKIIGVTLTDLTSGDVRWNAIYNIDNGLLKSEDLPVAGNKPYFQPDWCPAPGDFMAHKFRLLIKNLDSMQRSGSDIAGSIYFTLYGSPLLANSYQWENNDEHAYAVPDQRPQAAQTAPPRAAAAFPAAVLHASLSCAVVLASPTRRGRRCQSTSRSCAGARAALQPCSSRSSLRRSLRRTLRCPGACARPLAAFL